jgi:uncharacterized protein (TIGR03118 family)
MKLASRRPLALGAGAVLTLTLALPATAADAHNASQRTAARLAATTYTQTNLVSDVPGWAEVTDPHLVNPWGASFLGASPLWVSDAGTGLSTLYAGGVHGTPQTKNPLVVTIPGGLPTGQVSNGSATDFVVTDAAGTSDVARFIFVGLSGHISGWSPTVGVTGTPPSTNAQDAVVTPGAVYTGLAMGTVPKGPRLYVANFAAGEVEMYKGNWKEVHIRGAFKDRMLPKNYAPFNVMVSGNRVYVAYAKRAADGDEQAGAGLGRIDVFSLNGRLVRRMATHHDLNAPWGMTIAPEGFGSFAGHLVVGNFGNGRIHAFNPKTLKETGTLRDGHGRAITIDGLWTLMPGNGTEGGTDQLLFTAGPDDETHGLLGTLTADVG